MYGYIISLQKVGEISNFSLNLENPRSGCIRFKRYFPKLILKCNVNNLHTQIT